MSARRAAAFRRSARAGFDHATRDYRSVAAIVLGLAIVQAGVSALGAYAPISLAAGGEPAWAVGVVASAYGAGFLLGAVSAPNTIRSLGHIRGFTAAAGVATVLALSLFAFPGVATFALIEAGIGFCGAGLLTAGESWVAEVAPRERRGALLAYYLVVSKVGQIAGPIAISSMAPASAGGFMAIGAMLAASLVPVSATRRAQPAAPSNTPFGVRELWATAPAAVIAALVAGAVNGSVLQLYALFARDVVAGEGMRAAATFNAALAIGALAAQWPAGWLSDRTDRRNVILGLALGACAISLVLGFGAASLPWGATLLLGGLWGAGAMSFYGVAVAHAADRAAPGQATGMMSGILVVWALGALIGPLIAGAVMSSALGGPALFLYAAVGLAALAAATALRRLRVPAPSRAEKSPFALAPATSTAAAVIDPRSDDGGSQPDLFSAQPERPQ